MIDREKAIVMAHTGKCMLTGDKFQIFHKYVENIMGRPIYTHDIGFLEDEIKEKSKTDFIMLCANEEQEPCEDAISREEAIDACNQSVNILEATDRIKDLPPVTPQEPFMNKPCVAHQVCHEDKVKILDKIRAEIDKQYDGVRTYNLSCAEGLEMALGIIEKYKAESEDSHEIDRCR